MLPKTRSGKVLRVVLKNMANGQPVNPPGTIEDLTALEYAKEALAALGYPAPNAAASAPAAADKTGPLFGSSGSLYKM